MKLAPAALLLILTATALAQAPSPASFQPPKPTQPFTDPANLRGERVAPLTGHELPLDKSEVQGGRGLQQLLRKLNTRASLMLIVAHPDDEDGGMLTLYSRGLGARVADLSLNRGEGGQNAMTGDFEDALGLIRTQELLSADRYFDASQMFGTEVDFGFSKTKEEAFSKWNHQRVLYDVVRAIRLYRPLVIASVWIGGVTDGHGQHQVAGEIAQEAFVAAADPTVFPELTAEGILPWAPLKVYARVPRQAVTAQGLFDYATNQYTPARFTNYVTGAVTTTLPSADVVIHEGTTDPLLTPAGASPADLAVNPGERNLLANPTTPLSYVQFARIGLGLQRSQVGPGMRLPPPGAFDIAYHLYGSRLCNAPADTRPTASIASPISAPQNCHPERSEGPASIPTPNLSSRPESAHFADAVERPATPSAAALPTDASSLESQPSFFDGIDTTLTGIATLAPDAPTTFHLSLKLLAAEIALATDFTTPQVAAGDLRAALAQDDRLMQQVVHLSISPTERANVLHELRIKRVQLNDALVLALGLTLTASSPTQDVITHSTADATVQLSQSSQSPIVYNSVESRNSLGAGIEEGTGLTTSEPSLAPGHPLATECGLSPDLTAAATRPYFSRPNIEQPYYDLSNPDLRNAPATPPALSCYVQVTYNGVPLILGAVATHGSQPISIVPPVSIVASPRATVFPLTQTKSELTATLRTAASTPANVNVESPHNWTIEATLAPLSAPRTGPSSEIHFYLHPTAGITGPQLFHITAQTPDHHTYSEGFRPIGYPGLIYTNYYTPATDRIVPVDLNLPAPNHRRIAYLPGTGDAVPEALSSIGLTPTILTVADLTPASLAKYDTVILGVRTYNAHPDLHGAPTQALLDYAKNGGNVLVQYQTAEFTAADAPYPLTLGNAEKVVDETDPVKLLKPDNPLLTTPNLITPADFNGWIEERGHGFLHTWDPRYTALTETHDPGVSGASGPETAPQLPQLGGLITTQLGRGRWTYCAFALYRQLPEAVPGAYRLFVNLLNP